MPRSASTGCRSAEALGRLVLAVVAEEEDFQLGKLGRPLAGLPRLPQCREPGNSHHEREQGENEPHGLLLLQKTNHRDIHFAASMIMMVMATLKNWVNHSDKILSTLCRSLVDRILLKVKFQATPFEKTLVKRETKRGIA